MQSPNLSENERSIAEAALKEAIKAVGTSKKFATELGVKPQAVSQWDIVPINRVVAVEALTGVARHRLRPDFYPPEQKHRAVQATGRAA